MRKAKRRNRVIAWAKRKHNRKILACSAFAVACILMGSCSRIENRGLQFDSRFSYVGPIGDATVWKFEPFGAYMLCTDYELSVIYDQYGQPYKGFNSDSILKE